MTGPLSSDQRAALQNAFVLLKQSQARLAAFEAQQHEPIAIVGLGCRFPGRVTNAQDYWDLLRCGRDAIREVPPDRFDIQAFFDPDPAAPGKMYTRWGGFLDHIDQFDAEFFGISPREALRMDPQHRLLTEVAWEALENAGLAPQQLRGTQSGVFVGVIFCEYAIMQSHDPAQFDIYSGTGSTNCIAANRLSYLLDWHGPSLALDTACSSSLVAVHMACQSLRRRETDLALAGGVNLQVGPEMTIALCRAQMMSPAGRCKTFDASADGYVRGEGCGMIVLKRLAEAVRDGDRVLAVIRGTAVNHDGRSNGMTAPNGPAQEAVLRAALQDAGLEPHDVSYIEAHGTGTRLGDPIETEALLEVFCQGRAADQPLTIGSAKTNFGHLEGAAGIAGLIKTVLMLQHRQIPPHLHLQQINPLLKLEGQPVRIPTALQEWTSGEQPLRAGASSFGFGGTNAHVILEEAPSRPVLLDGLKRPQHILTLSARTPTALQQLAARYAEHLEQHPDDSLADMAFTANTGRAVFDHRLAAIGPSVPDVQQQLAAFAAQPDSAGVVHGVVQPNHRVAMLFTGQGSQYAAMGRALYATQPVFRAAFDQCAEILAHYLDRPLLELFEPDGGDLLDQTGYTQPALFALQYALATLWRSWGVEPAALMGHSVGEFAAAAIAGVLSLEDGLRLIAARARLMQALPSGGIMAAVFAGESDVVEAFGKDAGHVAIAALNGPRSTTISGDTPAVQRVLARLVERGIKTKLLATSHAFHSHRVEPMLDELVAVAAQLDVGTPKIPLVANLSGAVADDGTYTDARYWAHHARQPVQFAAGMQTLAGLGCNIFLEIGPNPTLIGMGQWCLPGNQPLWLPSLRAGQDDWDTLLGSLAKLYVRGLPVDWRSFDRAYHRRRVALPTYPFERRRYWIATQPKPTEAAAAAATLKGPHHPLLGAQLVLPISDKVFQVQVSAGRQDVPSHYQVHGVSVMPSSVWLEMALAAAAALSPSHVWNLEAVQTLSPLVLSAEPQTLQTVVTDEGNGIYRFRIVGVHQPKEGDPTFTTYAEGVLRGQSPAPAAPSRSVALDELAMASLPREPEASAELLPPAYPHVERGESFRWLCSVRPLGSKAIGHFRAPQASDQLDQFVAHPGLLDACVQLLARTAGETYGENASFVPRGLTRLVVRGRPAGRTSCCVTITGNDADTVSGDIDVISEAGEPLITITGLQLQRVSDDWWARLVAGRAPDWMYELTWSQQPKPARGAADSSGRWLVVAGRSELGPKLVDELTARGADAELLAGASPAQLGSALEQRSGATARPWRAVVDLRGVDLGTTADGAPDFAAAADTGWGGVLDLVHTFAQPGLARTPQLNIVTRGAVAVTGDEPAHALAASPVWGMARVIAAEHADLAPRRFDLDVQPAADEVRRLADELLGAERDDQIAYRAGQRYVARLRPAAAINNATPGFSLRADATYLVTGGLGGLGLRLARWLADRGARHLVLVGRSRPSAEAQTQLSALSAKGVRVATRQCDLGKRDQVAELLAELRRGDAALRGIFHLAGVLDDGLLREQSRERFERVMSAKAHGAWYLHELTLEEPLDHFVLFSSAAALLGAPGQGNYAAANALLDALAHHRRAGGRVATSINWGSWSEVGMAARLGAAETQRLAAAGVGWIDETRGLQTLEQILAEDRVHVGVLPIDWARFLERIPAGAEPAWLMEIAAQHRDASATSRTIDNDWLEGLQRLAPAEQFDAVLERISQTAARILGWRDAQPPDPRRPLNHLGFDSLTGVELCNAIGHLIGRHIDPTILFDRSTLEKLAEYVTYDLLGLDGAASHSGSQVAMDVASTGQLDAVQQQALAEVQDLDDAEMESLINQQLERLGR